jgi:hypothetical protein
MVAFRPPVTLGLGERPPSGELLKHRADPIDAEAPQALLDGFHQIFLGHPRRRLHRLENRLLDGTIATVVLDFEGEKSGHGELGGAGAMFIGQLRPKGGHPDPPDLRPLQGDAVGVGGPFHQEREVDGGLDGAVPAQPVAGPGGRPLALPRVHIFALVMDKHDGGAGGFGELPEIPHDLAHGGGVLLGAAFHRGEVIQDHQLHPQTLHALLERRDRPDIPRIEPGRRHGGIGEGDPGREVPGPAPGRQNARG